MVGVFTLQISANATNQAPDPDPRGLVLNHLQAFHWGKGKANLSIVINFSSYEA